MRFHGEYKHTVDAKGRVSLPSKFRKVLPEELLVVPGFGGALYVFEENAFDTWVDSLFANKEEGYNPKKREDVMLRKYLNARAESVVVDKAGRITLSAKKRSDAGIDKDVWIIGDDDHLEIWDEQKYEEQMQGFSLDDMFEA